MEAFLLYRPYSCDSGRTGDVSETKKHMVSKPGVGYVWWWPILLLYAASNLQSSKLTNKISRQIYKFFTPSPARAGR